MDEAKSTTRLAAVMSADIVGYSRLMGTDSESTVRRLADYRRAISHCVDEYSGRLVDFVGDNFLAEFASASAAVDCALEIQDTLAAANADIDARAKMLLRIGLHLGEVRVEGDRIFGPAINIAARIESATEPGGVSVSETVQQQLSASPQFRLDDLGRKEFKNIEGSVRMYRVRRSSETAGAMGGVEDAEQVPVVAVLPFANMSADPDQEFFSDGMAEEIISALAQIPGLRVIARTSAFRFKGTNTDVRSIGQILGAGVVVEGSVRRSGDLLRIAAQLVDTATGHQLWSQVFDRDAGNVFAIQDEIARSVVEVVRPRLLPDRQSNEPIVAAPTQNPQAYELYLRAGHRLDNLNRWDTRLAVAMLEDATELDSRFSGAWSRLGSACCAMEFSFEPDGEWLNKAERAVERALELDRRNAEAEFVRARTLWSPRRGFKHLDALAALDRAMQLQPGNFDALLWRSIILFHVGLFHEAETGLSEVLAGDPESSMAHQALGQVYAFSGKSAKSLEHHRRSLEIAPGNFYAMSFNPANHIYIDDLATAERELDKARALLPDEPLLEATQALLWARHGESQRAEESIERTNQMKRSLGHLHHCDHFIACAHALLGDTERAAERLARAADTGFPNFPLFQGDKHLQRLPADDAAFRSLMTRLERQWRQFRSFVHR